MPFALETLVPLIGQALFRLPVIGMRHCGRTGAAVRPVPTRGSPLPAFSQADLDIETDAVLGLGGFGRVMRATWKACAHRGAAEDDSIALKMLFVAKTLPEELLKSFEVEALAMAAMRHRNIIQLYGACVRPPHLCLMQELAPYGRRAPLPTSAPARAPACPKFLQSDPSTPVPRRAESPPSTPGAPLTAWHLHPSSSLWPFSSRSLDKLLGKVPFASLSWSARWAMAADCARAVTFIHSQRLIHKDVKSPNFLVFDAPASSRVPYLLKAADFGMSEIKSHTHPRRQNGTLITTGTFGATNWRAPELWEEDSVPSQAADVYGLGCTMYEIAAHEIPWAGIPADRNMEIGGLVRDGYRPERPNGCVNAFWDLVGKAWEGPPAARPSANQLLNELEKCFQEALVAEDQAKKMQQAATDTAAAAVRELVSTAMPGGVLSVVAAMRRFSFHAGVQELGCQALQNLAATASDSVKLSAEQGLQAVRFPSLFLRFARR